MDYGAELSYFRVSFLLLYLESWHFTPRDERLTPASQRKRERDASESGMERKGLRTKRRESGMESFMLTVCVETAVTE